MNFITFTLLWINVGSILKITSSRETHFSLFIWMKKKVLDGNLSFLWIILKWPTFSLFTSEPNKNSLIMYSYISLLIESKELFLKESLSLSTFMELLLAKFLGKDSEIPLKTLTLEELNCLCIIVKIYLIAILYHFSSKLKKVK